MQQNSPQATSIGALIKDAFGYWSRTMLYQIFFSLLYFSVLFLVVFYFAGKYGIMEQYLALSEKMKQGTDAYIAGTKEIIENPNYIRFSWIITGTFVFLHPLNLGLLKIFRKIDLGEQPNITDIFAGYTGVNFFIYIGFYLFWFIIYLNTMPTIILGVIWIIITLFSAPLMFFMNKRIFETILLSFKAFRNFPLEILVCCLFAFAFKYLGLFSFVGAVFTFPFWNAIIYVLYKRIFNEVKN